MREIGRRLKRHRRREIPLEGLRPAAVAVPLIPGADGLSLLLTVRTHDVEHHRGEISFPGGRMDPGDADLQAAALRETWEEVGIPPRELQVVGTLDDFVAISGYRITPFVVYRDTARAPLRPQPSEVAEILLVPLAHLLDPSHHRSEQLPDRRFSIHHFRWGRHDIWGVTAAILKRFLDVGFDFSGPP